MRYFVESGCSLDDASALMPHGRALGSTRSGPRSLDASRSLMASGSTPLMPQGSAAASALFKAVAPRHQQQERPHLTYARRPRLTLVLAVIRCIRVSPSRMSYFVESCLT